MPKLVVFILVVLVGFFTGILSGLIGIGGGGVRKPFLLYLGATPIETLASTIPPIIPMAAAGTWHYHRARLTDWRIVAYASVTGGLVAISSSIIAHEFSPFGKTLLLLVVVGIMLWTAFMLFDEKDAIRVGGKYSAWKAIVAGAVAGTANGMLGIGGGVILLPAFARFLKLPLKAAIATSLACIGLISIPSTVTHTILGDINWFFAGALIVGEIPGAYVGSLFTLRSHEKGIRTTAAIALVILSLVMATKIFIG